MKFEQIMGPLIVKCLLSKNDLELSQIISKALECFRM